MRIETKLQQNVTEIGDVAHCSKPIKVGLSACLAGLPVRHNGGHTQSRLCLNILSDYFQYRSFCPEVAAGFSTPRPAMRLVGDPDQPRLTLSQDQDVDFSAQLRKGFEPVMKQFANLDGYILMKNSPSCGLERVKVYQNNGYPHQKRGRGIFAQALKSHLPQLPIEEEGRLHDAQLLENFVLRVFAHHQFREQVQSVPCMHALINFHSENKYLLMAHSPISYKKLGQLLSGQSLLEIDTLVELYFQHFMAALSKPATKSNHCNALLHILGYLKSTVPSAARQHIVRIIHKYRQGIVPLTTPLTLLRHYLNEYGSDYIRRQRYLHPYPENLGLANHI